MHTHLPTRSAWSRAWLWTLSASLAWPAHTAPLVFSQLPPASAIPPPPNVIVTLDDSGSMGAGVAFLAGQSYPIPPGPDGTPLRAELPPPPTTGGNVTAQVYTDGYAGTTTTNTTIPASVPVEARAAYVRWYGFYRNRNMAMKASVLSTFNSQVIPDGKVRLAWQGLWVTCATGFTTGGCANSMWPLSDSEGGRKHRTNFFNWVRSVPPAGGTPLGAAYERAGQYLMTTGLNSPYAHRPGSTQLPEISCRRSYQVMFTDGVGSGWPGEQDNVSRVLPDGTPYVPRGPYAHNWAGTLSDVAFRYWATDLQTGANFQNDINPILRVPGTQRFGKEDVPPYWNPNNNPASWQNLVTYAIAFGEAAAITDPQWGGSTTAGPQFAQLVDGTRQWPVSAAPDLWHAAVNSRGAMYLATDQAAVTAAFKSVMDEIASQNVSSGGAASSFSLDGANFRTVRAGYTSAPNLRGTLSGFGLGANGLIESTPKWEGNGELTKVAHDKRTVLTAAGPTGGVPFRWANLSTWQKGELEKSMTGAADGRGSARLDYLRGDTSKELAIDPTQPTTPVGPPWVVASVAGPAAASTELALSSATVTGGAIYPDSENRPANAAQRPTSAFPSHSTSGNWLAVGGVNTNNGGGTATLVLPGGVSAFGFLWGTPDSPNTVKVNTNLGSQTFTAPQVSGLTQSVDPNIASYVKFEAVPGVAITSVEFSSPASAPLEVANVWAGSRSGFLALTNANVSGGALYTDMLASATNGAERPVSNASSLSTVGSWLAVGTGHNNNGGGSMARLTLPSGTRSLSFLWARPTPSTRSPSTRVQAARACHPRRSSRARSRPTGRPPT